MKKIRYSVVLKVHSPVLWLHPLVSAPSNGAQFPGAISEGQAKCHCRRTGNVQMTGKDMQRKMCKKLNRSRSFFWQAFTHWLTFSLFPLCRSFFQSFAALRLGCCSSNIQTNYIHCGFIFTYPWANTVLQPTPPSELLSYCRLRISIPLWLFFCQHL